MSAELQPATQLDAATAQQIVDRVRAGLLSLDADVATLYHGGAAVALGYGAGAKGWAALCAALFADLEWLRPTPAARLEKVLELRRREMPTRAIGDALGVSAPTISTDLAKLRERGEELPDNVVSLDGHRRSATESRPRPQVPVAELPDLGLTQLMHTALEQVWLAGDTGLTCLELQQALRWREGRCTSLLFRLRSAGLIGTDRAVRREDYAVHVATLPD